MTVFELAMQGRAHLRENIPCQDKTSTSERNGVRCIALADGAGSASLSHFGAQAAVEAITELLSERFAEFYNSPAAEDVKSSIVLAIYAALEATRETCGCQMSDLASTLLFVAVKDNAYIIGQIGDGVIVFCRDGSLKVASKPENGEFANLTWFTTSPNPENHLRLFKGNLSGITGFILMSDGAAESLYLRRTEEPAPILKYMLIASHCKKNTYLRHELTSFFQDYILQRTTDDCSIAFMSTYKSDIDFYNSLTREEKFRLFDTQKHVKKCYMDEYVDILINARKIQHLKILSCVTKIRLGTLKRRLRRLQSMGFSAVTKKFH